MTLSGPMFEQDNQHFRSVHGKQGAHYNIFQITGGIAALKDIFPEGEADDMNFALFSTSGVHGSYLTLDELARGIDKYGDEPEFEDDEEPEDYAGDQLTVIIVQPRIVCLRYGNITVKKDDLPYLRKLQATSWSAAAEIGK